MLWQFYAKISNKVMAVRCYFIWFFSTVHKKIIYEPTGTCPNQIFKLPFSGFFWVELSNFNIFDILWDYLFFNWMEFFEIYFHTFFSYNLWNWFYFE